MYVCYVYIYVMYEYVRYVKYVIHYALDCFDRQTSCWYCSFMLKKISLSFFPFFCQISPRRERKRKRGKGRIFGIYSKLDSKRQGIQKNRKIYWPEYSQSVYFYLSFSLSFLLRNKWTIFPDGESRIWVKWEARGFFREKEKKWRKEYEKRRRRKI